MVVSEAEAAMAAGHSAVSSQRRAERSPGVLVKPAYYRRFFKQLWTLLYHKQGVRHRVEVDDLSTFALTD